MTSLTPHEDAARALIAEAEAAIADKIGGGDDKAMRYRLNHAVSAAFVVAQARELDRGYQHEDILIANVIVLGNLIATIVSTDAELDTQSLAALAAAADLIDEIWTQIQSRLGPRSKRPALHVMVKAPAVGSA